MVNKKTTTKKAPAKKAAVKKAAQTSIVAHVDIGFGNTLYVRGEGGGLSWDKGTPLQNTSSSEWTFSPTKATGTVTFKFLINDEIWAEGENLTIKAGNKSVNSPEFVW